MCIDLHLTKQSTAVKTSLLTGPVMLAEVKPASHMSAVKDVTVLDKKSTRDSMEMSALKSVDELQYVIVVHLYW